MNGLKKGNMTVEEKKINYHGMSSVDTGEHVFSSAGGLKPNFTSI